MTVARGIRDYMSRGWGAAREAKDRWWGDRVARLGPGEALRIADELRRQVLLQVPGWPTVEQRREDLACHIRVSELLRRADRARRA
jgi:hypothetical protein